MSGQACQLQEMLNRFQLLGQLADMVESNWQLENNWSKEPQANEDYTEIVEGLEDNDGWPNLESY